MHRWLLLLLLAPPAGAFEVLQAVSARGVEGRRPVEVDDRFSADEVVYVFLELENREQPFGLTLQWFHDDRFVVADPVRIGTAERWRTWIRRRLRSTDGGAWRVVVQDAAGHERAVVAFTVGDSGAPESPQLVDTQPDSPAPLPASVTTAAVLPTPANLPCHALLNLRTSPPDQPPRHVVAELRFGKHVEIDSTDGLVQRTEQGLVLLWLQTRESQSATAHGTVHHTWDELWSVPLDGTEGHVQVAFPALLPPPENPIAESGLREDNRLEVMSILGPWLGLQAHLTGVGPVGAFDRSRFLTVGQPSDLKTLVGPGLVELAIEAAQRGAEALGDRAVGIELHDFRQAALVQTQSGLEVWGRFRCCQREPRSGGLPVRIPLHAPPPPVRPYSADAKGIFHRDGCSVGLDGPRIIARAQADEPFRVVSAPRLVPFALLGVVWLDQPFSLEQVEAQSRRLLVAP